MATFVVIPVSERTDILDSKIREFGNKFFKLPVDGWLIAYDGTSRQLSKHLGITEGDQDSDASTENAIIFNVSGYWGQADKGVWEWLSVHGR